MSLHAVHAVRMGLLVALSCGLSIATVTVVLRVLLRRARARRVRAG